MSDDPIVVGVDGSATSIYALRWAVQEAERLDLPVHAVLAVPSAREAPEAERAAQMLDIAVDAAISPIRRLRRRVTAQVVAGETVGVLIAKSHGAVLLVLGRALGVDPLHASTMAQCLRKAACPVAVVPTTAPAPEVADQVATSGVHAATSGLSEQPVSGIMQRQLLAVSTTTGLDAALQLMVGAGIHHLPVTDNGRCVGLLSESDLVWRMAAWPFNDAPPAADDIARKPAPVVSYDQTVGQAAAVMFDRNSDAVLVADDRNVVGILTTNDLLALIAHPGEGDVRGRVTP